MNKWTNIFPLGFIPYPAFIGAIYFQVFISALCAKSMDLHYSLHTTPIQSILPCTVVLMQLNTQAPLSVGLCTSYNVLHVLASNCSVVFTSAKSRFVKKKRSIFGFQTYCRSPLWKAPCWLMLKHDRAAADRATCMINEIYKGFPPQNSGSSAGEQRQLEK